MWRGLYTAATGMITESRRTDVIANNLANVNTTGFKKDEAVTSDFEPMLIRRIDDQREKDVTTFKGFSLGNGAPVVGQLGLGSQVSDIVTDYSQGSMQTTGNPMDLAIQGNGFFIIETPQGERYTRDGNFYKSATNRLVTVNCQNVLDDRGRPIDLPPEAVHVTINENGAISADGNPVARLGFVEFAAGRDAVAKEGASLYRAMEGQQPIPGTGSIQQGALERSNTEIVSEMVNMIANYRSYEASSKAVVTQDNLLDKSVNEVGRL